MMNAIVLTDKGPQLRTDYPMPSPGAGEALIRVRLAGICATDLQLLAGYKGGYRGVLGHEFVGDVVEAPSAPQWIGRRVVGEINIGCGQCDLCRRGLGKHCRARRTLGIIDHDGAFAEYITLPVANLHAAPATLSDEQAVFTEPVAAALEILEQVHLHPASRVYVLGDGRLGQLVAQVLAMTGCDLTVLGRHESKLAVLQRFGILVRRTRSADLIDEDARAASGLHPADVVVEATGSPQGFIDACRLVRPQGVLVLKSTFAGDPLSVLAGFDINRLVVNEITVLGSRCGPFAPALQMLVTGRVQVEPLVHARFPLKDGVVALHHAQQKGVLKVLIQP
jgi:threonine dehydrogenase-like Zn-dependent dehydrogenase